MKHFTGNFLVALSIIAMLLGTVMVPGTEAMTHHGGGGGNIAELLAAGLVVSLIRHHYGRRRRSLDESLYHHESRHIPYRM
ncbi:hypothetical protein TNCT_669221 [Trichonephila clavata]|uniref:Uncharacterized protein n=1 Tax=Trichonephila clavata TaxID=2740835 RepID=A0A8X6IFA2_TRICU|nr:hypothetical protein TNCT_669221 [Trichonephila clavata]